MKSSISIESVAREHPTPFYLIDLESARESFLRIRKTKSTGSLIV